MIKNSLYIRSTGELIKVIKNSLNPKGDDSRWNNDLLLMGLREGVLWVGERLRLPYEVELDVPGSNRVELPAHVRGEMDVEAKRNLTLPSSLNSVSYTRVTSFSVNEQDGSRYLVLPSSLSGTLRIRYWEPNPVLPTERVELGADLLIDEMDDLVLDKLVPGAYNGYVKVSGEIVRFQGATHGENTVLHNLKRAQQGTIAAYSTGQEVEFCVASHSLTVYQAIQWWALSWLHGTFLNRGSDQERESHDMQQRVYMQLAIDHMRTQYYAGRTPVMRLNREAAPGRR